MNLRLRCEAPLGAESSLDEEIRTLAGITAFYTANVGA
jgi:hypothetical protein